MAEGLNSRDMQWDAVNNTEALGEMHANTHNVAKIMGVSELKLLSFPDNWMDSVDLLEVVKQIELVVEGFQPDMVKNI